MRRPGVASTPPPLIETPEGWLMLYHGVRHNASGALYRLGLALFDLEHPDRCLLRGDEWIFGPEASLYPVSDLEEAIAAVNDSDFGLAASVITRERATFDYCIGRVQTGVLNWNRGTIGASGKLPFGGGKKSGNHRPAAILATLYCTEPQSLMLNDGGFDPKTLPPGVPEP